MSSDTKERLTNIPPNTTFMFGAGGHARELSEFVLHNQSMSGGNNESCIVYVTPTGTEKVLRTHKPNIAVFDNLGTSPDDEFFDTITENEFIGMLESEEAQDNPTSASVVLGIGSPKIREKVVYRLQKYRNIHYQNFYAVGSHISKFSWERFCPETFTGLIVGPGCVITVGVSVGQHVHLNTSCTLCHDVNIGDFSIIGPGSVICGNVDIGKRCCIGAGATVIDNVSITDDVTLGAGATVVENITKPGTYVGTPAKFLKQGSL